MIILNFLTNHWADILTVIALFFIVTAPLLPPEFAGMNKEYFDTHLQRVVPQKRQSLIDALTTAAFYTSIRSILSVVTLKGTTSLIMFSVIGVDLVTHKSISNNAVIISVVGIIALYADHLIANAEEFSIGGKLFYYKRKN